LNIWNGTHFYGGGTEVSAPTAAGVFALVNDARLAAGLPTLGLLNPWLYKRGYKAFTDVTSGSALGCYDLADSGLGLPATKGWDAVTGFGTPNFPAILESLGLNNVTWEHTGGWGGYVNETLYVS